MCGIAGAISFKHPACSSETLTSMARALAHRGPDDETIYQDDYFSFAFRRLSIVDVEDGQQPIWNEEEDIFIAVNGEIYNHLELRKELKQEHSFRTQSDSEVVLHLYEEFGVDALKLLNGMFAIVIWDKRKDILLLARDRLGIKPLYYTLNNDKLLFASELKGLLMHPDCPRDVNWNDLEILNMQQKSNISTYVKDVHFLEAGSYAIFDKHTGLAKSVYWDLDSSIKLASSSTKSTQEFEDEYAYLLNDSVNKQLMSDVPVGIFLSGGIDSSLITAIAAQKNPRVHCFTVVERTTYQAGDVQQAKDIAKQLGIPFYPVYFDTDKIAADFGLSDLEEMVYLIESPRFDPEWLFKSELHRAAKHYVPELKVILLGQGADEFAGGYSNSLGSANSNWEDYLRNDVLPDIDFYKQVESEIPERLQQVVKPLNNISKNGGYHNKMKLLVNQMQYFNLWHEDRTSSYHGIESRVPFLDHRLVELLVSVPSDKQADLFWDKAIVRSVLHKTIDDYPKDKRKIPFFVTDDISSINEFAWKICVNLYPHFKVKYLMNSLVVNLDSDYCSELFSCAINRRHNLYEAAWKLIEIMTIAIFSRYLQKPRDFISNVRLDKAPLPLVADADWLHLEKEFQTSPQNKNVFSCSASDLVNIPEYCEILNPLTENDGSTCIILCHKGKQVRRLLIDDSHYWLIQVIDEMGRHMESPKSMDFWCIKSGASEQDFYLFMNQLVAGGVLERVGN